MAGRLPGTPRPPGSGRKRSTLDKETRQMLSGYDGQLHEDKSRRVPLPLSLPNPDKKRKKSVVTPVVSHS